MTVTVAERRAGPFVGNGATTSFPFSFKVFDSDDLQVIFVDAAGARSTLSNGTDYSITLNADQDLHPGGSIAYPLAGSPMASPETLAAIGALPYEQGTDISSVGRFRPEVIENALDYLVILIQQLLEAQDRMLRFPAGEDGVTDLPALADRANKYFTFDMSGNPSASNGTGADLGLREDLAETTGANLVGFSQANVYAAASVGFRLKNTIYTTDLPYDVQADNDAATNTLGLQAAIDEAAATGKQLYTPGNVLPYLISGGVTVPSSLTWAGAGKYLSVFKLDDGFNVSGFGAADVSHVTLIGLGFDGNRANNVTSNGLRFSGVCTDLNVHSCDFSNWASFGLEMGGTGSRRANITDTSADGNGFDGILLLGIEYARVAGCTFESNDRYGVLVGPLANYAHISGCYALTNGESGFTGTGFGSSLNAPTFVGNTSISNVQYGFNCVTVTNVTYQSNIAVDNGVDGMGVTLTSPFAKFIGNRASDNGRVGFAVDSESHYSEVIGNTSLTNGWEGISIYRSANCTVDGNTCLNNGQRDAIDPDPQGVHRYAGIKIFDTALAPNNIPSDKCKVVGNTCEDTGGDTQKIGIEFEDAVDYSTGAVVQGNSSTGHSISNLTAIPQNIAACAGNTGFSMPPIPVVLANGWVDYDPVWESPSYYKTDDGVVHMSGSMKSGTITAATIITTLPLEDRPAKVAGPFACEGNGTAVFLYVDTSGHVVAASALNATRTSLAGISFKTT